MFFNISRHKWPLYYIAGEYFVQGFAKTAQSYTNSFTRGATGDILAALYHPSSSHTSDCVPRGDLTVSPCGPALPTISYRMIPKAYTSPFCVPLHGVFAARSNSGAVHRRSAQHDMVNATVSIGYGTPPSEWDKQERRRTQRSTPLYNKIGLRR